MMEPAPLAKGRAQDGEWAAAWVAALVKEAAGVAWAALALGLGATAFAQVAVQQWRTGRAFPATRSSVPSAGSQ